MHVNPDDVAPPERWWANKSTNKTVMSVEVVSILEAQHWAACS
jgi:hypothetical protein